MININENRLSLELNNNNLTAKVINSPQAKGSVFIPRSILHKSIEYLIISIDKYSFQSNKSIKSIDFPDDSEIITIDEGAFSDSSIESLKIPAKLTELKEGWCKNTVQLTNISISPQNTNFALIDDKFIVGKNDSKSDIYDVLIFAKRNIKSTTIPSHIKRISSYSFSHCSNLESIEISENSELAEIGEYSFAFSSIENIDIPKSVTRIGQNSFMWCKFLNSISFPKDSKLAKIEKGVFSHSPIKSIFIPSSVEELADGWCFEMSRLTNVDISESNENFMFFNKEMIIGKNGGCYDFLLFARRDIEKAVIPSCVKNIGSFAFSFSACLESVEFFEDSELLSIGEGAFSYSPIKAISIPEKVEELKEGWCMWTSELTSVSVSPRNVNFKIIDDKFVVGKNDPKSDIFDVIMFAKRDIKSGIIPSHIKRISSFSFSYCSKLENIEIEENSELTEIGEYSFSCSSIKNIRIPKSVTKIGRNSFMWCKLLHTINFPEDSELSSIENQAFVFSSLEFVSIPAKVRNVGDDLFMSCNDLRAIEFLGDGLSIDKIGCRNLIVVSLPNAQQASICRSKIYLFPLCCSIFISPGAKIVQ